MKHSEKMKDMLYTAAAALLLTAGLSSCSGDDDGLTTVTPAAEENNNATTVTLTATLGAKDGDETRALDTDGKTTTWAVGEKIAVVYKNTSSATVEAVAEVKSVESGVATITAKLTNPVSGTVSLVYPASVSDGEGGIDWSGLLKNQKGTTADISANWDVATASGVTLTVSGSTATLPASGLKLTSEVCVVKFSLMKQGYQDIYASELRIATGDGCYTVTPASNAATLYVAMKPVSAAAVSFGATINDDVFTATFPTVTLEKGKFYKNASVTLYEVTAADLGITVNGKKVFWASMNLGASKVTDNGSYYAWGEMVPKSEYTWANYKWSNGSETTLTKYNNQSNYGTVDNKTTLEDEDDVVHFLLGGDWYIPTREEYKELLNNTTIAQQTNSSVNGLQLTSKVTGYTSRSIFLPVTDKKQYWTSTLRDSDPRSSYMQSVRYDEPQIAEGSSFRNLGLLIRPVKRVSE